MAQGATSRLGKTIEQLYAGKSDTPKQPFVPVEEVVSTLKQRPKVFHSLAFELEGPDGTVRIRTAAEEHGYALTVLWGSHRPESARVSAYTYTLDSLVAKKDGRYHATTSLVIGQGVAFRVLAPNSTAEPGARKNSARGSL
jgi:hypothetical protein